MTKSSYANTVLFWGAVWGLAEATVGWLLHTVHIPHTGLWMTPLGLVCMTFALLASGKASSAFAVAAVATLVKLTNLLLPTAQPAFYTLNPAGYILLEGLIVFAAAKFISFTRLPKPKPIRLDVVAPPMATGCLLLAAIATNVLL